MNIGEREIGPSHPPFFIAEAGVNHNGDLDIAKELIDVAADVGADAVKFQTFSADRLVTREASKAEYQKETTEEGSQYDMLKRYELDREFHEILFEHSEERGIKFLSTPFDQESADMLRDLGVNAIKLGSGDLDNIPLIKHISEFGLPLIVSTGMGTIEEVNEAYEAIQTINSDVDVVFLHCTSAYPCSIDDVNLRAMRSIENDLGTLVGYSDHTTLPETPALAVAAGACVLEKHFTIDSSLPGPDHEASLEPEELADCLSLVDTAVKALGNSKKHPVSAEMENRTVSRKSLHAATDIESGTVLSEGDIKIVRPAEGISPKQYQATLGRKVARDLSENDAVTEEDLL